VLPQLPEQRSVPKKLLARWHEVVGPHWAVRHRAWICSSKYIQEMFARARFHASIDNKRNDLNHQFISFANHQREGDGGSEPWIVRWSQAGGKRSMANGKRNVREAVGVFETAHAFQAAIDELLSSGFHRAQLSLLASEADIRSKLGTKYRKVEELQDNLGVQRAAYVSTEAIGDGQGALIGGLAYVGAGVLMGPVAAAGGALTAIASAAVLGAGAGAFVGTWLAKMLGAQHAQRIEEQLARGGLLLWVRILEPQEEQSALRILRTHAGRDVHLHDCDLESCVPVAAWSKPISMADLQMPSAMRTRCDN
jgi:hypothetical protein